MWHSDDDSEQTNSSDDDIIALLNPQINNKSKTSSDSKPLLYQKGKTEHEIRGGTGTFQQHNHKQNHVAKLQQKKSYDINDILSSMNKSENIRPKTDSKSEKMNLNYDKQMHKSNYPFNEKKSNYHPPKSSASPSPKSNIEISTNHTLNSISQGVEPKSLSMLSSASTTSLNRQASKSSSSSKSR